MLPWPFCIGVIDFWVWLVDGWDEEGEVKKLSMEFRSRGLRKFDGAFCGEELLYGFSDWF